MDVSEIQKETFLKLLQQIRTEVHHLKKQNKDLNRQNLKLKSRLDDMQKKQTDIFSNISESERIALKHKVSGLIDKIDKHIDS